MPDESVFSAHPPFFSQNAFFERRNEVKKEGINVDVLSSNDGCGELKNESACRIVLKDMLETERL